MKKISWLKDMKAMLKDAKKNDKDISIDKDGKVIHFNKYGLEGCFTLKTITDDGQYLYEMFWRNNAEDSGEYFFSVLLLDKPITSVESLMFPPEKYYYFNKEILTSLVLNKEEDIISKARELDAEVLGKEYSEKSSYRGNAPWASIDDAIRIAEEDIANGKVTSNYIDKIIRDTLDEAKKNGHIK